MLESILEFSLSSIKEYCALNCFNPRLYGTVAGLKHNTRGISNTIAAKSLGFMQIAMISEENFSLLNGLAYSK